MTDFRIWTMERSWPSDSIGYVFLARAIQRIGSAMFGDAWVGSEPTLQLFEVPKYPSGDISLLHIPARIVRRKSVPASVQADRERIVDEGAALIRLHSLYKTILTACQSGQLTTAARPREGGEMTELASSVWNTDRWLVRFETCEIDVAKPFRHPWTEDEGAWIFVTSQSLEKMLLSQKHHRVTAEELPHLSPYMRTMIAVAKKVGISPDNQEKIDYLILEINAAWKEPTSLSKHLARVMATLIREPESQQGSRTPKRAKKKG